MRSHALLLMLLLALAACSSAPPDAPPEEPQANAAVDPLPLDHPPVSRAAAETVVAAPAIAADVASPAALVEAYYAALSGDGIPAGTERDWERYLSLFLPGARLVSVTPDSSGGVPIVLTPEQFVQMNRRYFEGSGYAERGVETSVDEFGNVAQVRSAYEARRHGNAEAYSRGVNLFQLVRIGGQWKIVNIAWDRERQ